MRALNWNGSEFSLDPAYPTPAADDLSSLIRVRLAGICSTDLQILRGYMGFRGVLGHEMVGEVVEGPRELVGKRVVSEINFACGRCESCGIGLGRHCPRRRVMGILGAGGSFAEYVAAPTENLHLVPDGLSDEEAVFTEPLAAAFEILEQVELNFSDEVLVLGDGKLGLLCAQALRLTGARVSAVGKHEKKLAILKKLGIRALPLSDWKPHPCDVVVEATGSTSGLKIAIDAVRPRGTLVLKSTLAHDHSLSLAPVVINEITVVGSRCGPFPPALEALANKSISVTPLIEKVYPLNEGVEAVADAGRSGALKVLLRP
ncbi:MAG: alcohol dehydrogenase catalytic domain-containing protein [Deltaproteobacteria bacterium]|nr:alcohol dehydrogenase catalytic domain-containing protein [Deltaproteobacteria bacterium]